jgi:hypothetical protein
LSGRAGVSVVDLFAIEGGAAARRSLSSLGGSCLSRLAVRAEAHGQDAWAPSKPDGANFDVKVESKGLGQANIRESPSTFAKGLAGKALDASESVDRPDV